MVPPPYVCHKLSAFQKPHLQHLAGCNKQDSYLLGYLPRGIRQAWGFLSLPFLISPYDLYIMTIDLIFNPGGWFLRYSDHSYKILILLCFYLDHTVKQLLSLIHISEPTRLGMISYAV